MTTSLPHAGAEGAVEGCAYVHQRAQDLGLFNGANLARNPAFRFTSRSNQLADEWSVAGPIDALTISGGQGCRRSPVANCGNGSRCGLVVVTCCART